MFSNGFSLAILIGDTIYWQEFQQQNNLEIDFAATFSEILENHPESFSKRIQKFKIPKKKIKKQRGSRPEVFCISDVLKNFIKFLEKHVCQSLFLIKLQNAALQLS